MAELEHRVFSKMTCMVEAEAYYMVKGTVPLSSTLHPSLTGGGRSPEQGQGRQPQEDVHSLPAGSSGKQTKPWRNWVCFLPEAQAASKLAEAR